MTDNDLLLEAKKASLRILQAAADLSESIVANDSLSNSFLDPRDYGIGDHYGFGPLPPGAVPVWLDRKKKGEYIPAFLTESQLSWLRRRLRALVVNNEIAQAVITARQSYAVGRGFKYKAVAKEDGTPEILVDQVQRVLDIFCDYNRMSERENEMIFRLDSEGEVFLRAFPQPNGLLALRFVEPDMVRSPLGDNDSAENSFGVMTKKHDIESVEGYWIVEGLPDEKPNPVLVPADEVLHIKYFETPSFSKRGLSPFYSIETNLRFAEDLLTSTVSLAKNRAKIAMIRKLKGTVSSVAQTLLNNQADLNVTDPVTQDSVTMERFRFGTIMTLPDSADYEFPSADMAASDHVAVYQMIVRSIGARFNMPEYLISSDASGTNYASTLAAEAPFVRTMQRIQDHLAISLARRRYGNKSLMWRQVFYAIKCGLLPASTPELIDLQVEPPSLVVRDLAKEAQVDEIYNRMGAKSLTTIRLEQGLDPDVEEEHLSNERTSPNQGVQPAGNAGGNPPGMPGGLGQGHQGTGVNVSKQQVVYPRSPASGG
jgi:hypothetical protein